MKKLIVILILLISGVTFSQDGYNQTKEHYQNVIRLTTNLDSITASNNVKIMVNQTLNNYSYLYTIATSKTNTYVYRKVSQCATRSARIKPDENLIFKFTNDYNLVSIQGSYEDLVDIWLSTFIQNAYNENVLKDYRYRDLINKQLGINYRLSERNDIWTIKRLQ